jgi:hypothetical protein
MAMRACVLERSRHAVVARTCNAADIGGQRHTSAACKRLRKYR